MRSSPISCCKGLLLALALLWAASAEAAVAINSQESGGAGHHLITSPLTWTFTNTSGTLLIVGIGVNAQGNGPMQVTAVTYGGVAMSPVTGASGGYCLTAGQDLDNVWLYFLESPATGANTVSITWTSNGATTKDAIGAAISFTGENSSGPVANGVFATSDAVGCATLGTAAAVTVPSTTNGNIIVNVATAGTAWSGATSPATKSALLNVSGLDAGDNLILSTQSTSGGSVVTGDTVAASDLWGIAACEIVAATAGAPARTLLGVGQ